LSKLNRTLEDEELLVSRNTLQEALHRHLKEMHPLESPMQTGSFSKMMARQDVDFGSHHLAELTTALGDLLCWNYSDVILPKIEHEDAIPDRPFRNEESIETAPNVSSLRMETFLHGGSFLFTELLLSRLSSLSPFWKETKNYFHLHLHLHIDLFLRFGFNPPFPKMVAGSSIVTGEFLPNGKLLQRSQVSGDFPEILVMEVCKALCFRWASSLFTRVVPLALDLDAEFPFFVHGPERVSKEWRSFLPMLRLGVPLSANQPREERVFKETTGRAKGLMETDIQSYFLAELEAFIRQDELPKEPTKRREVLHLLSKKRTRLG
jgi:hypothetical protein